MVVEPASHLATWQSSVPSQVHTLFLQAVPVGQAALQVRLPPQPSPMGPPQYWPPLAVLHGMGTQVASPLHRPLAVSHTLPSPQLLPQSNLPPQPSPISPQ